MAFIGVVILGFGASILRVARVGLDPFTAANIGIGTSLGLSLGVYQLLFNIFLLILTFIFGKKYIGIGTVINMTLTGFFIDFFTNIWNRFFTMPSSLVIRGIFLIIGVLIFTFGAAFYMAPALGNSPYDAISPMIVDHTKQKYRKVRVIQDVSFAVIAFVFRGPVGIGTFINAFLTGPLITFWDERVCQPILKKWG